MLYPEDVRSYNRRAGVLIGRELLCGRLEMGSRLAWRSMGHLCGAVYGVILSGWAIRVILHSAHWDWAEHWHGVHGGISEEAGVAFGCSRS